jgi:hypothetical protein
MEYERPLGHHQRTKLTNHEYRKGEEVQAKGLDNILNKITTGNFSNNSYHQEHRHQLLVRIWGKRNPRILLVRM